MKELTLKEKIESENRRHKEELAYLRLQEKLRTSSEDEIIEMCLGRKSSSIVPKRKTTLREHVWGFWTKEPVRRKIGLKLLERAMVVTANVSEHSYLDLGRLKMSKTYYDVKIQLWPRAHLVIVKDSQVNPTDEMVIAWTKSVVGDKKVEVTRRQI